MSALGSIADPDLRSLLQSYRQEIFSSLNCHQLGTIVSFDKDKQTAKVQLAMQRVVFNKTQALGAKLQLNPTIVDYPVLVDCPVLVMGGGGGRLSFPITAGDTGVVLFNDRDIDNWYVAGGVSVPNSARTHDLSDGLVIVGFRNLTNVLANYDAANAVLQYLGGRIQVADKIGINNAATSLLHVLNSIITALTALDLAKTGASAAGPIAAAQADVTSLLK